MKPISKRKNELFTKIQNQFFQFDEKSKSFLSTKINFPNNLNSSPLLKDLKTSLLDISNNLKNYESFAGRIRFDQYQKLLDISDNIYIDKTYKYSLIPKYDKRILVDF